MEDNIEGIYAVELLVRLMIDDELYLVELLVRLMVDIELFDVDV